MRGVANVSAEPAQAFVELAPHVHATNDHPRTDDPELVGPHKTIGYVSPLGAIGHEVHVGVRIDMRDLFASTIPFVPHLQSERRRAFGRRTGRARRWVAVSGRPSSLGPGSYGNAHWGSDSVFTSLPSSLRIRTITLPFVKAQRWLAE